MNKTFKLFIRLIITLTLIFFLFMKIDIHKLLRSIDEINILLFLLASLMYLFSSFLSALRWKLFLPENPSLKKGKIFSLYMIGCFFNIFLPGIMGGDVVKIVLLKKLLGLKESISSVIIERYVGFLALLLLGFIFFLIFFKKMPDNWILYSIPAGFISLIFATTLPFLTNKLSFLQNVREYVKGFEKKIYFKAFVYSLLVQIIVMMSVYFIFISLNAPVKFYEVVIFLPIIILLSTLPISLSGLGVREWGFVVFFGNSVGNEKAIAVSLIWFFSVALASIFGGFEYLRFKDFIDVNYKE